jgi:predicted O-methyltransferase YrrM
MTTTNIPLITSVPKFRLGIPSHDNAIAAKNQFYASEQSIDFILENPKDFLISPLKGALDLCEYINSKIQVKHMLELNCFQGELSTIFAYKLNPNVLNVVERFASRPVKDVINDDSKFVTHNWENVRHNFYLRSKQYPSIVLHEGDEVSVLSKIEDDSLDFIYLGTNTKPERTRELIELYLPKLRNGGIMAGSDWGTSDTVYNITSLLGNVDAYFDDGSWAKKVNKIKLQTNTNKLKNIQNSRIGIGVQEQFFATDADIKFLSMLDNPVKVYLTGFLDFTEYLKKDSEQRGFKIKRIVEINCYQGETTSLMAKLLSPEELTVVDQFDKVDPSWPKNIALEDIRHNFKLRTKPYPYVKIIDDVDALEAADRFEDNSIDMIYINEYASYQYCWRLLAQWLPKIKTDGYICGWHWGSGNIVQAALDHFGEPDIFFKDSSWSKIKVWDNE